MNKLTMVLVLAILAAGIYLALNYLQPFTQASTFEDYSGINAQEFMRYRSEQGFELMYPQSFKVSQTTDAYNPVRVSFTASSQGLAEVVEIATVSESTDVLKNDAISILAPDERETLVEGKAFGNTAISFESKIAGEVVTVKQIYFQCSAYTAVMTSIIPQTFNQDSKAVNYMASAFKC